MQAAIRVLAALESVRHEEQARTDEVAGDGRPDPRHESVVSVATKEKILRGLPVGSARVEQREQLTGQHDQVNRHRDSNDLNQRPGGPGGAANPCRDAENSHDKDDKGGAADERRSQKSREPAVPYSRMDVPPRPQYRNAVTV
jgi:hypothetical protein